MGSPRKNGNSTALAHEVARGARAAGAEVEAFYLNDMEIKPCVACDACLETGEKDCIIDDDMKDLYPRLRQLDALVIASPIYWFCFSAQTKLFIDRLYSLIGLGVSHSLTGRKIGIVLSYGGAGLSDSGAGNAINILQDMFSYLGAPVVGIVHGSAYAAGEIKSNRKVMAEAYELGEKLAA